MSEKYQFRLMDLNHQEYEYWRSDDPNKQALKGMYFASRTEEREVVRFINSFNPKDLEEAQSIEKLLDEEKGCQNFDQLREVIKNKLQTKI